MIDVTWKIFSLTGNIETYLLLKEIEQNDLHVDDTDVSIHDNIPAELKG